MSNPPDPISSALPALPEGWHILGYETLDGGSLAIVGANKDIHRAWWSDHEGKTVGETRRLAAQATARVWTVEHDVLIEQVQFPLQDPFPMVDQFPDGRWLVANPRSRGTGNARILAADGTESRRIELGDGIEHLKIDAQQRVWVGWFDEGIFGNDNWRLPGHEWAPSAYGIAAFDDHGALLKHATLESMADCYALNVFGNEAWARPYTDFPLWQMNDEQERVWPTSAGGTRAIAVSYPYVLTAGGYQNQANMVFLVELDGQNARQLGKWRLPFGARIPAEVHLLDGRGDKLHVVRDHHWHRWCVRDFVGI
ncbi:MAG TPA: hypothetical protein VJ753_01685 [Rhizomicrobium sp.]|nr:hypothetical protein [Rhizomicrobium sp.]